MSTITKISVGGTTYDMQGDAAGFGTPTASVDSSVGTPSVTITASGPDTAKVFDFAFSNLKGETGAQGSKGDKGDAGDPTTYSSATLASASWSGSASPYTQAITVTGCTANSHPIIDVLMTSYSDTVLEAWSYIYRADSDANTVTFYAYSIPTVDLPVQIRAY